MNERNFKSLALVALALHTSVFDSGKPAWKKDADGKLVVDGNGDPVMIRSDGSEIALGTDTVSRLNAESKTHREAKEAAERKLESFSGIDPVKAKEAITKLESIDQSKLIDSGKLDEVKTQITKQFEEKLAEKDKTLGELNGKIGTMTAGQHFRDSQWVKDNVAVPVDMLMATFGGKFKYDGTNYYPVDAAGQPLPSTKKIGESASFEEGIERFVNDYQYKDLIMKGSSHSGSGSKGGGGGSNGGRIVRRSDFDAMSAGDQARTAAAAGKGELTISD